MRAHSNWPEGVRRQLARHFYGMSPELILEEEAREEQRELGRTPNYSKETISRDREADDPSTTDSPVVRNSKVAVSAYQVLVRRYVVGSKGLSLLVRTLLARCLTAWRFGCATSQGHNVWWSAGRHASVDLRRHAGQPFGEAIVSTIWNWHWDLGKRPRLHFFSFGEALSPAFALLAQNTHESAVTR